MEERFRQVLAKYAATGLDNRGEFLQRPADALRLIDDLERLGITILGVDEWLWANRAKGWIVQLTSSGPPIPDDIASRPDAAALGARLARDYLRTGLYPDTQWVNLLLDLPPGWPAVPDGTPSTDTLRPGPPGSATGEPTT